MAGGALDFLLDHMAALPATRALRPRMPGSGARLGLGGLPGSSPAVLIATLARALPQRLFVVVAPTPADAERWHADLRALADGVALYPQREALGAEEPHVEIAGERHVLRSDASTEYTQSVAAHLDATIRALGANLDPHRAAILAALTITDELFRTRAELKALGEEIVRRSSRVAYMLERAAEAAREITISGPPQETSEAKKTG